MGCFPRRLTAWSESKLKDGWEVVEKFPAVLVGKGGQLVCVVFLSEPGASSQKVGGNRVKLVAVPES